MAKLEKTVVSLDSETKRVLNNLTKALEKVAKSQSRLQWVNSPAGSQTAENPNLTRLSEPAEDLSGTNAAYEEGVSPEEWLDLAQNLADAVNETEV